MLNNEMAQTKALNLAIKEIEKKFGKETFYNSETNQINVIKTGSILLDNALGVGGFPKGKIIEIYGNESSGKTTIALQAIKECIKSNGNVAYIDAENAIDGNYLKTLDIDPNKVLIANPEHGEQAFAIIDALLKTQMVDLIVVDSVAALIPKSEYESSFEDQSMGAHARLMSKGLKMIQATVAKTNTCLIFINQLREKIGVLFGSNEITTGGRALRFFSSVRLDVRRSELIKNGNEIIGIKSKVSVTKNKVGVPFKSCFVNLYFNKGYDPIKEIIDFAIDYEVIKRVSSWFYFNDIKLSQGRNNLDLYLNQNPDLYEQIKSLVLTKIGGE